MYEECLEFNKYFIDRLNENFNFSQGATHHAAHARLLTNQLAFRAPPDSTSTGTLASESAQLAATPMTSQRHAEVRNCFFSASRDFVLGL